MQYISHSLMRLPICSRSRGERGIMGMQGPAYTPDFKLSKDPNSLTLEELENYGEGTSLLNTLDGKLYFIQKIIIKKVKSEFV